MLATVSDKKLQHSADGSMVDYYDPEVISANDYYPGGMLTPGRKFNNGIQYRYGFGSQEMDNEIYGNGNAYTAEFWEYDPRTGRRWNIDPKPNVSFSPYSVFEDNPIWHTDIKGDSTGGPGLLPFKQEHQLIILKEHGIL